MIGITVSCDDIYALNPQNAVLNAHTKGTAFTVPFGKYEYYLIYCSNIILLVMIDFLYPLPNCRHFRTMRNDD